MSEANVPSTREVQERILNIKRESDTTLLREYYILDHNVISLFESARTHDKDIGSRLADVVISAMAIAAYKHVNLGLIINAGLENDPGAVRADYDIEPTNYAYVLEKTVPIRVDQIFHGEMNDYFMDGMP